jgi:nucleotide-binding universal stress UspA family protein
MIKDILVNLGLGSDIAGNFALSIAQEFDATVLGVAPAYEPLVPGTILEGAAADVISLEWQKFEKLAQDAMARFDTTARRAGVSAGSLKIGASIDGYAAQIGDLARRFDLVVTAQAEPSKAESAEAAAAERLLFNSGRPVIMVPFIHKAGLKLDQVMVCWDGSRAAARAIADAMPFLVKANDAEIVMVKDEPRKTNMVPGADLAEHLARHGVKIKLTTLPGGDLDAGSALLSYAADIGADLLVMGGFGHSRFREFVLGGVTRTILETMTVPTLMSH